MLSNNNIPTGFQIISLSQDDLFIKYYAQQNGCVTVFLLPFVFLFIGHVGFLLLGLYHILHLNFWQALQYFSYGDGNLWYILLFIFSLLLLGVGTHHWLWSIWGITEIKADQHSLMINKNIFFFFIKHNVLKENIYYFLQLQDGGNSIDSFPSWKLEVVTNQKIYEGEINKITFLNIPIPEDALYKKIMLLDKQSIEKSKWLGEILADFYGVEFRPANKNT